MSIRTSHFICIFIALIAISLMVSTAEAAKYSGEFLELGVSARSLGMGGAYTAIVEDATAPFYNPAGLSSSKQKSLTFMHTETFGSLINHDFIGGTLPVKGKDAALGLALIRLGGGDIKITQLSNNPDYAGINPYDGNIYTVLKTTSHADYTALASYGTKWKKETAIGITAKIIYRKLADENAFGMGFDLGLKTKLFKRIQVGAVLKDASATFLSYSTGTIESIYPNLKLGLGYGFTKSRFTLLLSGDASIKFEHRDKSAQLSLGGASSDFMFGGEIKYKDIIAGRIGSYRGDFTAGAGIRLKKFVVDVAYLSNSYLDNTYRLNLTGIF